LALIRGQFQVRNGSGELVPAAPSPWLARQMPNDRPDVPAQLKSPPKLDTSMPLAFPATALTPGDPSADPPLS
jgi:hypothetical protein